MDCRFTPVNLPQCCYQPPSSNSVPSWFSNSHAFPPSLKQDPVASLFSNSHALTPSLKEDPVSSLFSNSHALTPSLKEDHAKTPPRDTATSVESPQRSTKELVKLLEVNFPSKGGESLPSEEDPTTTGEGDLAKPLQADLQNVLALKELDALNGRVVKLEQEHESIRCLVERQAEELSRLRANSEQRSLLSQREQIDSLLSAPSCRSIGQLAKHIPKFWLPVSFQLDPVLLHPRLVSILTVILQVTGSNLYHACSLLSMLCDDVTAKTLILRFPHLEFESMEIPAVALKLMNLVTQDISDALDHFLHPRPSTAKTIKEYLETLQGYTMRYTVPDDGLCLRRLCDVLRLKPQFSNLCTTYFAPCSYSKFLSKALSLCDDLIASRAELPVFNDPQIETPDALGCLDSSSANPDSNPPVLSSESS